jgi:DNA-binding response OmpR family regulator
MRRRSFNDVSLDPVNGWLVCGEHRENLPRAAAQVLEALLAARGNSVTGAKLRAHMRQPGHPEVSPENLGVAIYLLRRKLKRAGASTRIANRIGYGWRLVAVTERAAAD